MEGQVRAATGGCKVFCMCAMCLRVSNCGWCILAEYS